MAASHRSAFRTPAEPRIPRFQLYDEPPIAAEARFLHIETIASRSEPRGWTISAHAHRDLHQLLVIDRGGGTMHAGAAVVAFGAGTLLVVPAGVIHGFTFEPGTCGHIVTIGAGLASPLLGSIARLDAVLSAAHSIALVDRGLIDAAIPILAAETAAPARSGPVAAEAALRLLLVAAARALEDDAGSRPARIGRPAELVARFRSQIERWIGEDVSIGQHAAALGVSPSRLRAACVESAGASPIALVRDRKRIEARWMLAHGTGNVASIAYALGFADPAYFSRWFAGNEGRSPAAFRKAMAAEAAR